jgi:hypothetical protein
MNLLSRIVEYLYRRGCRSKANHHRLVTVFSLRCDAVPAEALLGAAFNAFRPGGDEHPANLARWWGDGRLRIERLQLWAGSKPDETGVYTWRAPAAKTLVHHYDLATAFGPLIMATTDSPFSAVSRFSTMMMSPSWIWSSIMECPRTRRA